MNKTVVFARSSKSNNLTVGIVGLPNTGKSTLFNFLTKNSVPAENYPFCTINPAYGKVEIDDPRVENLCNLYKPKNTVKSYLGVTDIAGLVKGASENVGLGNAFLDNIRNVDAIFHVVRCFVDSEVLHVESTVDPIRDINIVNDELRKKDLETLDKHHKKMVKDARAKPNDKKTIDKIHLVERILKVLETSWVNEQEYTDEEVSFISTLNLLTVKNVVYLANISEEDYSKKRVNKHFRALINFTKNVIPFSAIGEFKSEVRTPFINKLVKKGYEILDLINFFTVGKDEVRSWTIRRGITAPEAGSVIHTDFKTYFIMAEIMSYDDIKELKVKQKLKRMENITKGGKLMLLMMEILFFSNTIHQQVKVKKNKHLNLSFQKLEYNL